MKTKIIIIIVILFRIYSYQLYAQKNKIEQYALNDIVSIIDSLKILLNEKLTGTDSKFYFNPRTYIRKKETFFFEHSTYEILDSLFIYSDSSLNNVITSNKTKRLKKIKGVLFIDEVNFYKIAEKCDIFVSVSNKFLYNNDYYVAVVFHYLKCPYGMEIRYKFDSRGRLVKKCSFGFII